MIKYSIREVIEQAVQTEKLGYQFYTSLAEKFNDNDKLKKLFDILAGQELKHEKYFTELEGKLEDKSPENWEEVSQYLSAIVESEFFLGKNKSLPSMSKLEKAHDVIQFAMNFETQTLLYFQGLRDAFSDDTFIKKIIDEEKRHLLWLHELKNVIS
jgi:rubrerythrin